MPLDDIAMRVPRNIYLTKYETHRFCQRYIMRKNRLANFFSKLLTVNAKYHTATVFKKHVFGGHRELSLSTQTALRQLSQVG